MKRARNMVKISGHIKHDPLAFRLRRAHRDGPIRSDLADHDDLLVTLGYGGRNGDLCRTGDRRGDHQGRNPSLGHGLRSTENEVTAFNVLLADPGKDSAEVSTCAAWSMAEALEARVHTRQAERKRVDAVLYFDELHQEITGLEPVQQATFSAIVKAVPEYRRKLSLGWASLYTYPFTSAGYSRFSLASALVDAEEEQWSTISIPRLSDLLKEREVVYALLRGVEARYLDDIDEILTEEFRPYRGAFQHLDGTPLHRQLHECPPSFRVAGGDLRALYSAQDLYEEEWDRSAIERWRECGLFSSVEWEEDEARSSADQERARELLQGLFFDGH